MTNEEAVKHLKFMAMNLTGELATETNQHEQRYLGETLEAIDLAIDALGKQVPKRMKLQYRPFYCPSCGTRLKLSPYCWKCGQRIDYSQEEVKG